ncbi:MAG: DUF4136 domain-containing protein [Pseudomonadales bacterium]|jgi:hypothetical protein|nr:DUF4136 domain-containing protein [Pseudomonadales bacterium]
MNLRYQIRSITLLFSALLLSLVSACTSSIRGDVLTFHEGPRPSGETIRVVAADPDKQVSLEFRSYVNQIEAQLRRVGYRPTTDANAQLLAVVDYSVAPDAVSVSMMNRRPRYFVRYGFSYGRYYDPFYFGASNYWGPDMYTSHTNYLRTLLLNIEHNDKDRERLFEGHVQSSGMQNLLPQVMPYLITAMFQNFPGENGVTKVVTIERDKIAQ